MATRLHAGHSLLAPSPPLIWSYPELKSPLPCHLDTRQPQLALERPILP